ncbi:MAG: ABC transporter permease [candidate division KSB1 bacterium]|nr:ABC transporter permease [candidate division KSB1 bacterium]MDZ7302343.1 ABC transporter permease [candidate division KSB1 bacterium]MDZ7311196.1 ABC transporter permease [candidate division KSB1 bacterium]
MFTFLRFLGAQFLRFLFHVGNFGKLAYQTLLALADVRTYAGLVVEQMMRIGIRSLPIVGYISIFMGMVTALQAVKQFTQTVPMYISGTVVEKAILQELASAMTALVLAGRVGAAIAAEIGTMKVTEQIDALEAMAFNPVAYLVVPRLIAGMVMVPVLTVFAAFIGMISGWITAISLTDLTTFEFFKGVKMYVSWRDFALPLSKSVLFGASIIMVACYQGFNARQGAEGVGTAATNAAVSACLLILTLDFLMAKVILT